MSDERIDSLGRKVPEGFAHWPPPEPDYEADPANHPASSVPVPVWPDEATVERVATALADAYPDAGSDPTSDVFTDLARAALSVVPDPTGDTVLLDKVWEIVGEWDQRGATWCMKRIAALLAGGGE